MATLFAFITTYHLFSWLTGPLVARKNIAKVPNLKATVALEVTLCDDI